MGNLRRIIPIHRPMKQSKQSRHDENDRPALRLRTNFNVPVFETALENFIDEHVEIALLKIINARADYYTWTIVRDPKRPIERSLQLSNVQRQFRDIRRRLRTRRSSTKRSHREEPSVDETPATIVPTSEIYMGLRRLLATIRALSTSRTPTPLSSSRR
ncbi:PREDICTED: uncharacterized protein LOC108768882 [Trachymyrmex cornetzi]|uniref:uncharacterized protein LOC108768882 n=1 Tax=Trachymyrmex cornetzi TaxID=471704 RepID=UPI00084F4057|nr:PREDICTED: uncharacterized protein LOC108768882 [Trachymyrmex cornetzi]